MGVTSMVLVPIIFVTLVYLLAYIASNELKIRFYTKIIVGLVLLLSSYLASAIYEMNLLPNHVSGSTFGDFLISELCFNSWYLRPTATLLYTGQFFDVAYAQFDPLERPIWFWIR